MLDRLKRVLLGPQDRAVEQLPGESIQLAVAALLVEIARADMSRHESQARAKRRLLADYFRLSDPQAAALVQEAEAAVDQSVSLRDFTAPLHRRLAHAEKLMIIEMLWRVALADRELDRLEDHLVSKLAELLYVDRRDVLRLRDKVQGELAGDQSE
ncbi:MAG: TerB family tellurite resistance protein [Chromatiales bacterium]|nr:TerB family tellurite resistance protein [Chromatiales bacterium]